MSMFVMQSSKKTHPEADTTPLWSAGGGRYHLPVEPPSPPLKRIPHNDDAQEIIQRLRTEVTYLHKKVRYLQSVSNIFRQRIGIILREASRDPSKLSSLDDMYRHVVEEMFPGQGSPEEAEGDAPMATSNPLPSPKLSTQRISDVQKAHHLCLVLEEKNALKRRELELETENKMLRRALDGTSSNVPTLLDKLREENTKLLDKNNELESHFRESTLKESQHTMLSKQLYLAKGRSEKLRMELAEVREQKASETESTQETLRILSAQVNSLTLRLRESDMRVTHQNAEIATLKDKISSYHTQYNQATKKLSSLEEQRSTLESLGQGAQSQHEKTLSSLMNEVQKKDATIIHLKAVMSELQDKIDCMNTENKKKSAEVEALSSTKSSLELQVGQYEDMLQERHQYAGVLREVQRRLDHAVDDLKQSQDCSTIASQIGSLEAQVLRVQGLEDQIRQKDDIIALKDYELYRLRQQLQQLQSGVDSISTVLLRLPQSVQEIECAFIELEEYRNARVPNDEEIKQRARLRLLEAKSKRQQEQSRNNTVVASGGGDNALVAATMELLRKVEEEEEKDDDDIDLMPKLSVQKPQIRGGPPAQLTTSKGPQRAQSTNQTPTPTLSSTRTDAPGRHVEDDRVIRAFQLFDKDGSGAIPRTDVPFVLQAIGIDSASKADVDAAWSSLRLPSHSTRATPEQVTLLARELALRTFNRNSAVIQPRLTTPPKRPVDGMQDSDIVLTFQLFDEDGKGIMTPEQAIMGFNTLGVMVPAGLESRYSGGITLPDFVSLCKRAETIPNHHLNVSI